MNPRFFLVSGCFPVVIFRYRENLASVVPELDVKLRVVHRPLVFAVRIRLILILINQVAQWKRNEAPKAAGLPA